MSGCCVYGCQNRFSSSSGLKLSRIPKGAHPFQQNRKRLWLQAVKRVDENWTENTIRHARVCSAHFISDTIVISDSEWEEIPIEELTCKMPPPPPPSPQDCMTIINRAVNNLKRENARTGLQPYPGSDNFYANTPPNINLRDTTVRPQAITEAERAGRYKTITPQAIVEAEHTPKTYAASNPPPAPRGPATSQTTEQPTTDAESTNRAAAQPAEQPTTNEESAPPPHPAPVQKKRKKRNRRITPIQRLNWMKMAYLLLQINSGLVEIVQEVLSFYVKTFVLPLTGVIDLASVADGSQADDEAPHRCSGY
ncbi:uncharacterized protein [Nothobranchius furzeri]|uniref:uncharacterized protein isoform X2 n=1 Tax=Nothobranchius furzeri TaxID=105023 RepID=UPI002403B5F7|nr:uncharacterized protein LOC129164629 isoform X2 [Nothobranchius furzeri]